MHGHQTHSYYRHSALPTVASWWVISLARSRWSGDHLLPCQHAPAELSVKREGLFAECVGKGREDLADQCSAVHGVNPLRPHSLKAIHNAADWFLMRKNAGVTVQFAHRRTKILANDRRLIAGLDEEIGWEQAACALFPDHHGIPMMYVRSLEEAQRVPSPSNDF